MANAIIPAEWFDAAIDAHVKLGFKGEGARIASYDPSDLGPDDKGYALRHGSVVEEVDFNESGDVNEGTDWAIGKAIQGDADYFTWDGDGMGVALKRQIDQALDGKRIEYLMFRGPKPPSNRWPSTSTPPGTTPARARPIRKHFSTAGRSFTSGCGIAFTRPTGPW